MTPAGFLSMNITLPLLTTPNPEVTVADAVKEVVPTSIATGVTVVTLGFPVPSNVISDRSRRYGTDGMNQFSVSLVTPDWSTNRIA